MVVVARRSQWVHHSFGLVCVALGVDQGVAGSLGARQQLDERCQRDQLAGFAHPEEHGVAAL
ncbi:hypothetical protein G6O69_25435 [Pseudenhygromyxa sp. WMMC2535]|uniref:hypothetical protein n=1 Tax=Pseudenhygromyxa sp. WMMC2535 TaxID=2712867 RepID=UPI001552AA13|nr:hypothetical protein [Pseudenhygromyxa sp. WMMC2535]NVB41207.1 hypothetical protein [Pseudenhygromyxa sp. WMMC2535]